MKLFKNVLALLLACLLACPVTVLATENGKEEDDEYNDNYNYFSNWVVTEYSVDRNVIRKGDDVTITVYLVGNKAIESITPITGAFNHTEVVPDKSYENEGIISFSAEYTGVGKEFQFRVNGDQVYFTIHECEEYTQEEHTDQTTPVLQVGRHDQIKPIAKGETQTVTLWINNLTDRDLYDVVAVVSPSGDLQIMDNSVTYPIGRIWSGDVAFFDVTVKAFGEIASASQSLSVEISYAYEKDGILTPGTDTQTVPLSAIASQETSSMTASVPNVIVSGYDYGSEKISAGTAFDLKLEFQNTSSVKTVENIVMTIDPGTALAITSSSNSFHFSSLAAGGSQTQTVNLQALPDAPSAPAKVAVKFSYEYIDGNERRTVTQEQTVSLPVYQLDRFEITQDMSYIDSWQYQESFLTLSYINKGKGTVYNVSAELQGEIPAMSKTQNIGNVEAGRSGTIDFIITPELAGENTCKVVVSYEDDAMQVMTKEFDFDVFVNEMFVPEILPEEDMMIEEPQAKTGWIWIVLGAVAAGAVALVIVLKVRKKKKSGVVESFVFSDGTEDLDGLS